MSNALFRRYPRLAENVPWVSLIEEPTPVHRLNGIASRWDVDELFVKREDATDTTYGGNKVRNLEFLLGEALALGRREVLTLAPLGSNFVAALAAQTRRLGMKAYVKHFVPARSPQIESHWRFCEAQGIEETRFGGRLGAVPAWLSAVVTRELHPISRHWIAPGGSSVVGAMGHVSALLELREQIERGEAPVPDTIVVGAGTCGTMAGLLAGLRIAGLAIRLVGIRCVDRIVCHRGAIARLANGVLRRLGTDLTVAAKDVVLLDPPSHGGYGQPVEGAATLTREFLDEEEIRLDTTYTTKVVRMLKEIATAHRWNRTLYWHTFSGKAVPEETSAPSASSALPSRAVRPRKDLPPRHNPPAGRSAPPRPC